MGYFIDFTRDDPVADASDHADYVSQDSERCEECNEIIDDYKWEIEGCAFCDDCAKNLFRRRVY